MVPPLPPATLSERVFVVRRWLVLHRRFAGAALAFVAVFTALQVLAPDQQPASGSAAVSAPEAEAGLLQLPLRLADADVAGLLTAGDVVDVIGSEARGRTTVVASSLTVVDVPKSTGGFGTSGDGIVVVAVRSDQALTLAAAATQGPLTVAVHP
jgi:hypothetical protein